MSWFYLEYDAPLPGCWPWALVLANVFFRKLVDVRVSTFECLRYDATPNYDLVVHVVLIGDRNRNSRISSNVPLFYTSRCSVDEYRVALTVDPDRCDMRCTIWHDSDEESEILAFNQSNGFIVQFGRQINRTGAWSFWHDVRFARELEDRCVPLQAELLNDVESGSVLLALVFMLGLVL